MYHQKEYPNCKQPCTPQGDKLYMVAVIERGNYPKGDYLPGHTITLRTPVRLCNSLPVELTYKLLAGDTEKRGKFFFYRDIILT